MLRVGLTGGTACGKSTVAEMFSRRPGVFHLDADQLVRELYQPGTEIARRIAESFGPQVLDGSGAVDRKRLADIVFADDAKLQQLEAIVHPAVVKREQQWMDELGTRHPGAIALVEATKMLEAGTNTGYDHVVLVVCSPQTEEQRFLARHPEQTPEQARRELARRSRAQFPDERRRKMVDVDLIIDNSGSREQTESQVEKIYRRLLGELKTS